MTLNEHVVACIGDPIKTKGALRSFQAAVSKSAPLGEAIKAELANIHPDVLQRCWVTKRRHDILSQALGSD